MNRFASGHLGSHQTAPLYGTLALLLLAVATTPLMAETSIPGEEVAAVTLIPGTSTADFATGSHDGTTVSETDNGASGGQVRFSSSFEDMFLSPMLDDQWTITRPIGSYTPVIEDGLLDLQERDDDEFELSSMESQAAYEAGIVVEMRAAFYPGSAFVSLGLFDSTFSPDQWLYFSTRGSGDSPVPIINTSMHTATSSTINVPTSTTMSEFHVFRIVWTPGMAEFWVDGVLVDTRTDVDIDLPQHVGLYKSADSDSPCYVDWVRVTPYTATTGAYTSAVQDGGLAGRPWTRLTWQGDEPAGTTTAFATRTGEIAAPDASWSDWSDVAVDSVTSPVGRYLQYRASVASADSLLSPVIDEVQLEYSYLDITPPSVLTTSPDAGAVDVAVETAVTAMFDEPIDPTTLTDLSFTLTSAGGAPVLAVVGLDSTATVASLQPTATLDHETTYEARLNFDITDGDGNHLANDHVWSFTTLPPDLTGPEVVATVPMTGFAGVLVSRPLSVTFDEAIDPTTLTEVSFSVAPRGDGPVAASVTYDPESRRATLEPAADLAVGTIYDATVTTDVTDVVGNPLAAEVTWAFTTRTDTVTVLAATSAADFGAGTLDNLVITEIDSSDVGGQLRLTHYLDDRFDNPVLDPQWHTTRPEGYVPTIENGVLDVQERDDDVFDVSAMESYDAWGPNLVFEARAMFVPGSAFIDVGLDANTYNNTQYAWFSTAGTGAQPGDEIIYARVREVGHVTVEIETSATFNEWHVFKIIWTPGRIEFYVDGVLEAVHTDVLITRALHAALYKSNNSDTPLYVDWIRVSPYTENSGEYLSPVLAADADSSAWLDLQWSGMEPTDTSVAFATRTGDTAVTDETWSDWSDVVGGDITSPPARYAQYRAILTSTEPLASPVIDDVFVTYGARGDITPPNVIACLPAADSADVPLDAVIVAIFDEPMNPSTLTTESFTVMPIGGEFLPAVVTYDADSLLAILVPAAPLAFGTVYEARVAATVIDEAGNHLESVHVWTFTTVVDPVAAPDVPVMTALLPNAPNPFNPATTVRFDLSRAQRVNVQIYGIDGRLVRTLVTGDLAAGRHSRAWDGRDDAGRGAPTGVYVLRLATEDGTQTRKISMLK